MKAVVLAAGRGIRFRPVTDTIPKVMIKVGGKPMVERGLENLVAAGITEIILVIGYKGEIIRAYFKNSFKGINITYIEQEKQLGSADAIGKTKNVVKNEDFIVLNGDVIVETFFLKKLIKFSGFSVVVAARESDEPWRYGCLLLDKRLVKDIIEKPTKGTEPSNLVNVGLYKFSRKIFDAIEKISPSQRGEYEIVDAIKLLILNKEVSYLEYSGLCLDIGNQEDLKKAELELIGKNKIHDKIK